MTATEVYESVTNGGVNDFADVVAILQRHGPWCLIGGLAVNCFVEPVYTMDADLVVVAENLETISTELVAKGFLIRRFAHSLTAQRANSKLNIRFTTDGGHQEFLRDPTDAEVLGLKIPVASLENIVRAKVWAWRNRERRLSKRKKDELDLIRIAESYPKLRALMPAEITSQQ